MQAKLDSRDVIINGPNYDILTLPENEFFDKLVSGVDVSNFLPLPEVVDVWHNAIISGIDVLAFEGKGHLYVICKDVAQDFAMFHYVRDSRDPNDKFAYRWNFEYPFRVIKLEGVVIEMSGMNGLRDYAQQSGANRGVGVGTMNLNMGMNNNAQDMYQNAQDGVSSNVSSMTIQRTILAKGYVMGYIMGTAPAISLALPPKKNKGGEVTYSIVARESKPSRPLAVLMALPKNCVTRQGITANPSDIMNGNVDFNQSSPDEMVYQNFPVQAAISYIGAFGGRLPEYAPTAIGASKQWSEEDILANHPDVSFVRIHPTENKNRASNNQEKFRFSLKTTSPRRSLYTQWNHVCLRALEHVNLKCESDEDAYRLNESAFGAWRYRKPKAETRTTLDKAYAECPSQIWAKKYNISGQEVDGIGSVFFMNGMTDMNEAGESITKKELVYWPWHQTGALRPETPTVVPRIVKRTLRPATDDKAERMVNTPIYLKDAENHEMFRGYAKFIAAITGDKTPFITKEKLLSLGARTSRASKRFTALTGDQLSSLQDFMNSESVMQAVNSVKEEAATRAVLNNY